MSATAPDRDAPAPLPIDRPFRFTWDFCVVWALFAVLTFFVTSGTDLGPSYSEAAIVLLVSLFVTFALYGSVLLVRAVVQSGARGRAVARDLSLVLLAAALLFGALMCFVYFGLYQESGARIVAFVFTMAATAFMKWRLDGRSTGLPELTARRMLLIAVVAALALEGAVFWLAKDIPAGHSPTWFDILHLPGIRLGFSMNLGNPALSIFVLCTGVLQFYVLSLLGLHLLKLAFGRNSRTNPDDPSSTRDATPSP